MHELKFGRRTIDIAVQNEFSLNMRPKERLIGHVFFHTKKSHQLCFSSRDQILAIPKDIAQTAPRGGF